MPELTAWSLDRLRTAVKRNLTGFLGRKGAVIVVETWNEYAKVASLERHKGAAGRITSIHVLRLPPGEPDRTEAILQLLDEPQFKPHAALALLIPRNLISAKTLTIPYAEPDELEQMVRLQAQRLSPFPPDDLVSDFSAMCNGDVSIGSRIMLYSTRKSVILEHIWILEQSGRRVDRVCLSTELVKDFVFGEKEVSRFIGEFGAVVVDVDYAVTNILIIQQDKLLYSRAISKGIIDLEDGMAEATTAAWCEQVAGEIEKTIAACKTDHEGLATDKMVITGASHGATRLNDYIAGRFSKHTFLCSQENSVGVATDESEAAAQILQRYSFCSFVGLLTHPETKEIDFLPPETRRRRHAASIHRQLSKTVLLILTLMALAVLYLNIKLAEKQDYFNLLQSQLAMTSDTAAEVEAKRRQVRLIEEQSGREEDVLESLMELYKHSPSSIVMEYVDYSHKKRVVLRGRATNLDEVLSLVESLKRSSIFKTAGLDFANTPEQGSGYGTRFQITAEFGGVGR